MHVVNRMVASGAGAEGAFAPFTLPPNRITLGTSVKATDTTDQTTYTFAGVNLGAVTSDRKLAITVYARTLGAGFTLTSVTVAGNAATVQASQVTADNANMAAIYTIADSVNSTATIVLTFSSANPLARCAITVTPMYGASSITAAASGGSLDVQNPAATLAVPARGAAIMVSGGSASAANPPTSTPSNFIERFDEGLEATNCAWSEGDSVLASGSTTFTFAWSAAFGGGAAVAAFATWGP